MKRRGDIGIELTPLLDVILIMLFMIMSRSSSEAQAAKEEAAAQSERYEAQLSAMKEIVAEESAELENAEAVIESYRTFENYARIVSVTVTNIGGGDRRIYLTCGDDETTVDFGWDNMKYGENSFKAELESIVRQSEGDPVFITFTYSSGKIFRRDHDMVTSVMDSVQSRNDNVYIQYSERDD